MKLNTDSILDHINHLTIYSRARYITAHLMLVNGHLKLVFKGIVGGMSTNLEEFELEAFCE